MEDTPEASTGAGARRAGSQRSLACFSVDENVLDVLWDEEIGMEELLEFSFDHIDKLAARRGKTVTSDEKLRLWDYVQRMRSEQGDWITSDAVVWDKVEERYTLRTKSLSLSTLPGELVPCGSGTQTPPPLLYSGRKLPPRQQPEASGGASIGENLCELQAGACLTQSEVWDMGSPRRLSVAAMRQKSAKKKQGWRRVLNKVFHTRPKQSIASESLAEFNEFLSGIVMSSSPSPAVPAPTAGGPASPAAFRKTRPTGLLRRSLRCAAMATKKKGDAGHSKVDEV